MAHNSPSDAQAMQLAFARNFSSTSTFCTSVVEAAKQSTLLVRSTATPPCQYAHAHTHTNIHMHARLTMDLRSPWMMGGSAACRKRQPEMTSISYRHVLESVHGCVLQ